MAFRKKSVYILASLLFSCVYSVRAQLDSIYSLADTISSPTDKIEWMLKTAYGYYSIDPAVTEAIGLHALKMSEDLHFEVGMAKANHILGIAYWTQGLYDKALSHNFVALRGYEKQGDERRQMLIKMNNANIYGELNRAREAIDILLTIIQKGKETQDTVMLGWAYNNISTEYRKIDDFDSSLYYSYQGLEYREITGDTLGIIGVKNNIGLSLNSIKKPQEAKKALLEARHLLRMKPNPKRLAEIYTNLSATYALLGQHERSKQYADSCITIAKEINDRRLESVSYGYLSDYFASINDFKKSLEYFKKSSLLSDSVNSEEVQKETKILQLQYDDEKKAKQLLALEKQQAKDQFDFWMAIIISVAILITALLMIYTLRLRVRNARLKSKELQSQLEQKNKELTSYALNFIQKNELLNELTDKIAELKKQGDTNSIRELNQMNGIINSSFRMDQDWDNFKLMFEELHGDFFARLKDRYPDLGNAELKLCALLRLNMNLKESSRILGISADSVKTARYRIRKKFGLSTEDNLVDFLIKFDGESQHLRIA